jgi:hypothetical protein
MFCLLYSPKQNIVKFHAQKQIVKLSRDRYLHLCREDMENTSLCIFQELTLYYIITEWLYTGCLKKTLWKFNRLSCIINVAKRFNFYIGRKNSYLAFQMILFLNRNGEKWPHTRQIKIVGRNHIQSVLPPLGIEC